MAEDNNRDAGAGKTQNARPESRPSAVSLPSSVLIRPLRRASYLL